ncbi:hypothetical protein HDU96_001803 [Phlyctochytrium bullatum]|nr:hypothetical protein HDU96_001803 [Phlyctochytrium bullatum]
MPPSPASTDSKPPVQTLDSLPLEIARCILLHLPLIEVLSLSAVSRGVRRLFRPADTEVQFAADHLLEHFPTLRGVPCDHGDSDDDESDDSGSIHSDGGDDASDWTDIDDDDDDCYDDSSDDSGDSYDSYDSNTSINAPAEYAGDDSDDDDESDGTDHDNTQVSKKRPHMSYKLANDRLLKHIRDLRRLPVCYALALLKIQDFEYEAIDTITFEFDEDRYFAYLDYSNKEREQAYLEILLLAGVCELGMGFQEVEYEWEGRWYRRKEAFRMVHSWAASTGSIEVARCIIETTKNSVKMLPLGYVGEKLSVQRGRKIVLLGKGDPKDVSESIQLLALDACHDGTVPLLRFLLDTYPASFANFAPLRTAYYGKTTYFHVAYKYEQEEVIRTLADYSKRPPYGQAPDPAQKYNPALSMVDPNSRMSLLQCAADEDNIAMVRLLLELGADPNFVWRPPHDEGCRGSCCRRVTRAGHDLPVLHVVCDSVMGSDELIPLLVAHGADPLQRNTAGCTALMKCGSGRAVRLLLKAVEQHMPLVKHELLSARSGNGNNVFHRTIEKSDIFTVGPFVEGIKKAGREDGGWELKKAVFGTKGRLNQTVLHMACTFDDLGKLVLDALMDGVERDTSAFGEMRELFLIVDDQGHTPVHAAAIKGLQKTLSKMLEVLSAVNDGMCKKVLETRAASKGRTPLHAAAKSGSLPCVRLLLKHGADPGIRDAAGRTPLMAAEAKRQEEVTRVLREVTPKEAAGREIAETKSRKKRK